MDNEKQYKRKKLMQSLASTSNKYDQRNVNQEIDKDKLLQRCKVAISELEKELEAQLEVNRELNQIIAEQRVTISTLECNTRKYAQQGQGLEEKDSINLRQSFNTSLSNYQNRTPDLSMTNEDLQTQIQHMKKKSRQLMEQNNLQETKIQALEQRLKDQTTDFKILFQNIDEDFKKSEIEMKKKYETQMFEYQKETQNRLKNQDFQSYDISTQRLQQEIIRSKEKNIILQEQNQRLLKQLEEKSNIVISLEDKELISTNKEKMLEGKINQLQSENQTLHEEVDSFQKKLWKLEGEKQNAQQFIGKLESVNKTDEKYIHKLTQELTEANQNLKKLQTDFEKQKQENLNCVKLIEEYENQKQILKQELVQIKTDQLAMYRNLEIERDKLMNRNQQLKEDYLQLQVSYDNLNSQSLQAQQIAHKQIQALQVQLENENQIRIASEDSLQSLQYQVKLLEEKFDKDTYSQNKAAKELNDIQDKFEHQLRSQQEFYSEKLQTQYNSLRDEITYLKQWSQNLGDQYQQSQVKIFMEHLKYVSNLMQVLNRLEGRLKWLGNIQQPLIYFIYLTFSLTSGLQNWQLSVKST